MTRTGQAEPRDAKPSLAEPNPADPGLSEPGSAEPGFVVTAPPDATTVYRPDYQLDLRIALMWVKTVSHRQGVHWWASNTPQGAATTAFRVVRNEVRADSWGPGAQWAISRLPALLGRDDQLDDFRPLDPVVAGLGEQLGSPRLGATGRWYEAMATMAIVQRVVRADALTSIGRLGRRYGETVSSDSPIPLFPRPEVVLRLADHDFHRAGVDLARTRVVRMAAKYADRLESLARISGADARQWLQLLPGVGPWTAGITAATAGGDPDAVPVGDLHVPRLVSYAFTGETNGDDARMLEVLEPYAGHRGRVVRMVKAAGIGPPNRSPSPFRFDISRI